MARLVGVNGYIMASFLLISSAHAQVPFPTGDITVGPDRPWHLLTRSYGGTVSLIKDLTKRECEFARDRTLGNPATDEEKRAAAKADRMMKERREAWKHEHNCTAASGWSTSGPSMVDKDGLCVYGHEFGGGTVIAVSSGDIKSAECFK